MQEPPEDTGTVATFEAVASRSRLPYVIEVWDPSASQTDRVVARAASRAVAQTIFNAVVTEQPGRRVRLRRGKAVLSEEGVAVGL